MEFMKIASYFYFRSEPIFNLIEEYYVVCTQCTSLKTFEEKQVHFFNGLQSEKTYSTAFVEA